MSKSQPRSLPQLGALQRARTLVRIHRVSLEQGHLTGRIVGCSAKLLAIASIGEGVRPNGFHVVRRADISTLMPDPYAEFIVASLQLRGNTLPRLPKVDLGSWQSLVAGVARRFPLVTLHVEATDPDVAFIGRPMRLTSRTATLVTIGPDAVWDRDDLLTLEWTDVTRVDFGGAYEEALALVGNRSGAGRPNGINRHVR